ncbi:MAG: hypothetical protein ACI35Y_08030, partial [Candidatus Limimorpha sp.]
MTFLLFYFVDIVFVNHALFFSKRIDGVVTHSTPRHFITIATLYFLSIERKLFMMSQFVNDVADYFPVEEVDG